MDDLALATMPPLMVEVISARSYYGRHGTGAVVLVNGRATHFAGKTCRKDATAYAENVRYALDGEICGANGAASGGLQAG